jgi:hypothetical protein
MTLSGVKQARSMGSALTSSDDPPTFLVEIRHRFVTSRTRKVARNPLDFTTFSELRHKKR